MFFYIVKLCVYFCGYGPNSDSTEYKKSRRSEERKKRQYKTATNFNAI